MSKRIEILQEEARRYLSSGGLLPKTPINTMDVDIDPTDKISRLPDEVLVHIASFLPSTPDLVYLSAVSRTWYHVWSLSPIWDFSEESFCSPKYPKTEYSEDYRTQKFVTFVHNTLSRQCHGNKKMDQFRLHMSSSPPLVRSFVDLWIELVLHFFGAKSLDISFSGTQSYFLPQTVLSAKELKVLRFAGGVIKLPEGHEWNSNWPSLRELHLLPSAIFDWMLVDNLISICPLIEKLYIHPRIGLQRIHLSGFTKLREVKVIDPFGFITTIMIDAPTLKLFHHTGLGNRLQMLDLKACKNLEELKLEPFCCTATAIPYVLPCLQNVSLGMSKHPIDFLKLGGFLGNFVSIQLLSLEIDPRDVPFNLECLTNSIINPPLLPNVKQLHLNIVTQSSSYGRNAVAKREDHRHLLDGLFWICHPKFMLLKAGRRTFKNDFIKVLCQTLQRIRRTKCCKSSLIKCWKHDLKGLEIKLIEADGSSSILTTSVQRLVQNQKMCFSFTW